MDIKSNILETIGNTPLIKLNKMAADIKATILVKSEMFNPGGSVKDRIGLNMIVDAEKRGVIKPGDIIVEPTSGNTGTGLALTAIIKGYQIIFTIPDKMSQEKIDLLRSFGAKVIVTPTSVPPDHPMNYVEVAKKIVRETPNAHMLNQFGNQANPEIHYQTTGPEIWEQTDGQVDVFVATMGTGGTISGTGRYLKEQNPKIKVIGVDPEGSMYHHHFNQTEGEVFSYKVEGIGEDFIPTTIDFDVIDEILVASDKDAFHTARRLVREEGIFAGGSAGMALFGALQFAQSEDVEQTIVVMLPDTGRNYLKKLYSDSWMIQNNFMESEGDEIEIRAILSVKQNKIRDVISVQPSDTLQHGFELMQKFGISQLPVIEDEVVVGSLNEKDLIKHLTADGPAVEKVKDLMAGPLAILDLNDKISSPLSLFSEQNAVLVKDHQKIVNVITPTDVLAFFLQHRRDIS